MSLGGSGITNMGGGSPPTRTGGRNKNEDDILWARCIQVGNLYKEVKDSNLIANISGHVENPHTFSRYRDIEEEMNK